MRKLYNEFFHIPKHGKIRDKVMLTRVVMTVAVILMCLVVMSVSAYAYFSCNITSSSSLIKVARFESSVSIKATNSNGEAVDITPETNDNQTHTAALTAGLYNVTLTLDPDNTAKTGFMILTAENCTETYHTQQLGKDSVAQGGETKEITFELTVTDSTVVKFVSSWGTSSYYDDYKINGDQEPLYITDNEQIKMIVNGIQELPANDPENGEEPLDDESKDDESTDSEPQTNEPQDSEPQASEPQAGEPDSDGTTDPSDSTDQPDQSDPADSADPETETPETQPTTDGAETSGETTPSV